jgi:hypothetical protein
MSRHREHVAVLEMRYSDGIYLLRGMFIMTSFSLFKITSPLGARLDTRSAWG